MKTTYIDNGFFRISRADAIKLAGKLPGHGRMKKVEHDGKQWWLMRTMTFNKGWTKRIQVWSIHQAR